MYDTFIRNSFSHCKQSVYPLSESPLCDRECRDPDVVQQQSISSNTPDLLFGDYFVAQDSSVPLLLSLPPITCNIS
jgi:hypothetical protein